MVQIDHAVGWKIVDGYEKGKKKWPWAAINAETREIRGPFDTSQEAIESLEATEKEEWEKQEAERKKKEELDG